jgi:hypothetical protein
VYPVTLGTMKKYTGNFKHYVHGNETLGDHKIYLNIKYLAKGNYELNIMDKNKLIKKTYFKKE